MLFVDLNQKKEIDIDEITGVSLIKSCMGDEENFYILANKKDKILGFYLLRFDLNHPEEKVKFLIDEDEIDKFYENNEDINIHGGRSKGLDILHNIDKFKDYQKKRFSNKKLKYDFWNVHRQTDILIYPSPIISDLKKNYFILEHESLI